MITIPIKRFGQHLIGREEGRMAYDIFKRDYIDSYPNETFFCDFEGIGIFAPSYADEVFGRLQTEYPDRFVIDEAALHHIKVSLETIEETRGIRFRYQPRP